MSNFDVCNHYYRSDFLQRKTKNGLRKDEAGWFVMMKFIGLRPKMYFFRRSSFLIMTASSARRNIGLMAARESLHRL